MQASDLLAFTRPDEMPARFPPFPSEEEAVMAGDIELVVLKDTGGEYYVLPRASLEKARVPSQHRAELERLIAAGSSPESGELDMEELAAVAGGVSSTGRLTISSSLASNISDTWGSTALKW